MLERLVIEKEYVGKSKMCSGNEYLITCTRKDNDKSIQFAFHDNIYNNSNDKSIIGAILSDTRAFDTTRDVFDFAREFGYELIEDCEKPYKGCKENSEKMHSLLNEEEMEELYQELEEYC